MSLRPYIPARVALSKACYSAAHLEPFCGTDYMIASRVSGYLAMPAYVTRQAYWPPY